MLLILEVQVLQDVNKILGPYTTLKQYVWLKRRIISVLEKGVEEVELVLEFRERFWFWGALVEDDLKESKIEAMQKADLKEAMPCKRDFSRHGM